MHWRGRTRPRGPSDGGAPQLKPGVNPLKSSTLRGSAAQFSARAAELVLRPSITLPKRRPRPGLEPVGQRDHHCGVPARRPKSQETTNFDFLKVAPQSKSRSQGAWVMKISDTGDQKIFTSVICRARPISRLRHCVPPLRSKVFTKTNIYKFRLNLLSNTLDAQNLFKTLRHCVPPLVKFFSPLRYAAPAPIISVRNFHNPGPLKDQ